MAYSAPGDRFGSRVVIREAGTHPTNGRRVLVRCDCGDERVVYARSLPNTKQCVKHNGGGRRRR